MKFITAILLTLTITLTATAQNLILSHTIEVSGVHCKSFDSTFGSLGNTYTTGSCYDPLILIKRDPEGNLLWTRNFGVGNVNFNSYYPTSNTMVTDIHDNLYLTGTFETDAHFWTGEDYIVLTSSEAPSAFIAKFNSDGDCLWAKSLGATASLAGTRNNYAVGQHIAIDTDFNVYTTGKFRGDC